MTTRPPPGKVSRAVCCVGGPDRDDDAVVHSHSAVLDHRKPLIHSHNVVASDDQIDRIARRFGRLLRRRAREQNQAGDNES
jgi:hypothetical protein